MSFKRQGLVGVPRQIEADKATSLTWLVNADFKGFIPAGSSGVSAALTQALNTHLTPPPIPRHCPDVCSLSPAALVASLSTFLMYLPGKVVADINEARREKDDKGQDAEDDLPSTVRDEIATLEAKIKRLRTMGKNKDTDSMSL